MIVCPELDHSYYREKYEDVAELSDAELIAHYQNLGTRQGRISSPLALRENIAQELSAHENILELGPFYRPFVTGDNVSYFDVLDSSQLHERATKNDKPTDRIPNRIEYVSPVGDMSIIADRFDAVISSHCIEHQPDLVRHLQHVERILETAGKVYFLVPDKRYVFDHFMLDTNITDVMDAYEEARVVHSKQSVVRQTAYVTHNDPRRHWKGDHGGYLRNLAGKVVQAEKEYEESNGAYIDVHAWYFTPSNFREIISQLNQRGLVGLQVQQVFETPRLRGEFVAILTKP